MQVFGYPKTDCANSGGPTELKEVSFRCSKEEWFRLCSFIKGLEAELADYDFPYGECTIQYRDRSKHWTPTEPDVVFVVSSTGNC